VVNDSADVTSSGRSFHVCGPAIGKARLPTIITNIITSEARRVEPLKEIGQLRFGAGMSEVGDEQS